MDLQKNQLSERRNAFVCFFRMLVMLHKIPYAYFTEWNNKRKRKALSQGIYALSILPEFVLLYGTLFAARGEDGYMHSDSMTLFQQVLFYASTGLAIALMAIPLGFGEDKKVCLEVRKELRERARYWKRAIAIYWAIILAIVVAINVVFPMMVANTEFPSPASFHNR